MTRNMYGRRIQVLGTWYTINQCDFNAGKNEDNDEFQWGGCSYNDKAILIDTEIPKSQEKPVLAHEVCHAVLQESNIDNLIQKTIAEAVEDTIKGKTIDLAELALRIEEAICDAMETGHKSFKNI